MVFTIRAVIEVLGYPEEHVKDITGKIIEKLKKEDGIQVLKEKVHNAEKIKEKFFSCFGEVELKINDFSRLLYFCSDYLPSNIEILDMDKISISSREFMIGINEILERLHNYNILVNNMTNQLKSLEKKEE
ncbi:MAG TPA: hypothetical protein VJI68_03340 [Candidatus Nanoarchaeia archaeon]|nr:hypothetical protein [Candidatus Nanoarchaeia archaeon]